MNIFVSNINFKMREQALSELFAQYGEVSSVRIIKNKETRRSIGYGFVEMPNESEARAAIAGLNGTIQQEREIVVDEGGKSRKDANTQPTGSAE